MKDRLLLTIGIIAGLAAIGALDPSPRTFLVAGLIFFGAAVLCFIIAFFWKSMEPEDPKKKERERLKMLVPLYRQRREEEKADQRREGLWELTGLVPAMLIIGALVVFLAIALMDLAAWTVGTARHFVADYGPVRQAPVVATVLKAGAMTHVPIGLKGSAFAGNVIRVERFDIACESKELEPNCEQRRLWARFGCDDRWRPVGREFRAPCPGPIEITLDGLFAGGGPAPRDKGLLYLAVEGKEVYITISSE